jgi:multidrug efflux pump subunit AcrA (membrane-fusion protein)
MPVHGDLRHFEQANLHPPLIHKHPKNSWWLVLALLITLIVLSIWAHWAQIDQIARASGQVIATARTQIVQSANDGVLETLFVKEGESVKKGQLLARLDPSQAQAAYDDSMAKVAALKAAQARLEAEVFGRPLVFPSEIKTYRAFIANQTALFHRRSEALHAEIQTLEDNLAWLQQELTLSKTLVPTGDIGQVEIIHLERQVADLKGQITNRRNRYFQETQAEMTKVQEDLTAQTQLLTERKAIYERTDITAPADGLIKTTPITTPGAKIRPGDVLIEMLPTDSALIIEAKLKPSDIAYIHEGLPAAIKLDAFDYSIYGILEGEVSYISPDALSEKTLGGEQIYYRVHIQFNVKQLEHSKNKHPEQSLDILPGMTASVDIRTGKQSVWKYFTKPITKTFSESLGER